MEHGWLLVIQIRLNSNDVRWATQVGQVRWRRARQRGSKARFAGANEGHHIDGAGGELAFCRALKLPWPASIDSYHNQPDVYPNWEIRTLRRKRGVKVTPEDHEDRLVVWVQGQMPVFTIMGYIRAGGAKQHSEWFDDPGNRSRSAWFVPENRMVPINPGFHAMCAYLQTEPGLWSCAFCGAGIESLVS